MAENTTTAKSASTVTSVGRFNPDRADGWALFLGADVLALRWLPLLDDAGTPYTTDYYQLNYLRERAAWGPELLLLPFITTRWGRLYVHDKDALVITLESGDRWLRDGGSTTAVVRRCPYTRNECFSGGPQIACDGKWMADGSLRDGCDEPCRFKREGKDHAG